MREIEKLDNGEWYYFLDKEVAKRKANAAKLCQEFNEIPATEPEKQTAKIKEIFGSYGKNISVQSRFNCDNGKNIHVGNDFLSNYNLSGKCKLRAIPGWTGTLGSLPFWADTFST